MDKESKKESYRKGKWTEEEDNLLLRCKNEGKAEGEIVSLLHRHKGSIRLRYGQLTGRVKGYKKGADKEVQEGPNIADKFSHIEESLKKHDDVFARVVKAMEALQSRYEPLLKGNGINPNITLLSPEARSLMSGGEGVGVPNMASEAISAILRNIGASQPTVDERMNRMVDERMNWAYRFMKLGVDLAKGRKVVGKDLT